MINRSATVIAFGVDCEGEKKVERIVCSFDQKEGKRQEGETDVFVVEMAQEFDLAQDPLCVLQVGKDVCDLLDGHLCVCGRVYRRTFEVPRGQFLPRLSVDAQLLKERKERKKESRNAHHTTPYAPCPMAWMG